MSDYEKFVGKRAVLVRKLDAPKEDGSTAEELEGTVDSYNELGLLFKPKGKVNLELVETDYIEDLRPITEAPKKLKQKTLKPVPYGQTRNHLLERHAFTLVQVNGMTEDQAVEAHNQIDHSVLGHVHSQPEQQEASENDDESSDSEQAA